MDVGNADFRTQTYTGNVMGESGFNFFASISIVLCVLRYSCDGRLRGSIRDVIVEKLKK